MISQAVLDYIKSQLDEGVDQSKIKSDLMSNGWSESDVDQAFSNFKNNSIPFNTKMLNNNSSIYTVSGIEKNPSNNKTKILLVSLVFSLLLISSGIYAYISGFNPFLKAPYSEENLVVGLLESFSKIQSGTYKVSSSMVVMDRESNIKPFEIQEITDEDIQSKFTRELKRIEDLRYIFYQLQNSGSKLPSRIEDIPNSGAYYKFNINDPLTQKPYDYKLKDNGEDFDLTVTFETHEIISQINRYSDYPDFNIVINGQSVTFSKGDDSVFSYIHISKNPPANFSSRLDELFSFISDDINIIFSLVVTSDWGAVDLPSRWKTNLEAVGDLGDFTYKANIDTLKNDDVYFIKINNFPSLGFLNIPKNQWIRIDPKELNKSEYGHPSYMPIDPDDLLEIENDFKKEKAELLELTKRVAKIADEEGVLELKNPVRREKKNDKWLYRYDLEVAQDKIVPFYTKLLEESKGSDGLIREALMSDVYLDKLGSQEFKNIIEYLEDSSFFTIWLDDKGYPIVMEYSLKFAPPDNNFQMKDKQLVFVLKLEMSDINKSIEIKNPEDSKSILEIFKEMYGYDYSELEERNKDTVTKAYLSGVRASAELLYSSLGSYGKNPFALGPCRKEKDTLFGEISVYEAINKSTLQDISKATCGSKIVDGKVSLYVISAPLNGKSGYSWCVDSKGASKEIMGNLEGYSCP